MRYMLFGWVAHSQEGGWSDFMGLFDTVEMAEKYLNDSTCHAGQIVNATSLQVEKEL